MSLDKATVARIAHLARIKLTEDQLDPMSRELSNILTWVEQLGEVDTNDVAPMTGIEHKGLRRRPDAVTDGAISGQVLANAPEAAGGFYTVPKVVE